MNDKLKKYKNILTTINTELRPHLEYVEHLWSFVNNNIRPILAMNPHPEIIPWDISDEHFDIIFNKNPNYQEVYSILTSLHLHPINDNVIFTIKRGMSLRLYNKTYILSQSNVQGALVFALLRVEDESIPSLDQYMEQIPQTIQPSFINIRSNDGTIVDCKKIMSTLAKTECLFLKKMYQTSAACSVDPTYDFGMEIKRQYLYSNITIKEPIEPVSTVFNDFHNYVVRAIEVEETNIELAGNLEITNTDS